MLIERLFSTGIMQMGPSRVDPARQVGVFNPSAVAGLPALRTAEMEKFRWIAGEWNYENEVPATAISPAYTDIGSARFAFNHRTGWMSMLSPDGQETPNITFDPFSKQWIYLLIKGSYGILRSKGWEGDTIAFTGPMTMIGIDTEWRITLTRHSSDSFSFVNEEPAQDGSWAYIDQWRFTRIS
ncbi:MAG TPA: hypothetical protein VGL00_05225 [Terracidiphilus sp.]